MLHTETTAAVHLQLEELRALVHEPYAVFAGHEHEERLEALGISGTAELQAAHFDVVDMCQVAVQVTEVEPEVRDAVDDGNDLVAAAALDVAALEQKPVDPLGARHLLGHA